MGVVVKEWKAPNKLDVPENLKTPGFGYKWVTKSRIQDRIGEGWQIVGRNGKIQNFNGEAKSLDGAYHVRELILCRMPQPMIDTRNEHYANKNRRRMQAVKNGAEITSEAEAVNASASNAHGLPKESFTKKIGKTRIAQPALRAKTLEPGLDEKKVQSDLASIDG